MPCLLIRTRLLDRFFAFIFSFFLRGGRGSERGVSGAERERERERGGGGGGGARERERERERELVCLQYCAHVYYDKYICKNSGANLL
jgi:hypothetical protein